MLSELHELKEEAPREFEVLKVIAELTVRIEDVYTGLIEETLKEKGLMVCRRSLEYYLSDLERRAFIKLKSIRIGKGHSTGSDRVSREDRKEPQSPDRLDREVALPTQGDRGRGLEGDLLRPGTSPTPAPPV